MSEQLSYTLIVDIDGTILHHHGDIVKITQYDGIALPGVLDKINEWNRKGYKVFLLTGRQECLREKTKKDLQELGIVYDQLIMGAGRGVRVLINDKKNDGTITAKSINLVRNIGLEGIEVEN